MDVGLAGGATWAAALGALTAFFAWLAKRTSRRESERRAYRRACDAWKEAISKGDALGAAEEKRKIDLMRRKGWHRLSVVLVASLAIAGCKTETVALTDHVRVIEPGETVPPLPAGEKVWWLCTPRGLTLLLPADADIPEEK